MTTPMTAAAAEIRLLATHPGQRSELPRGRSALRPYLAPVPDSLPPYDDERTALSRLRMLAAEQRAAEIRLLARGAEPDSISDTEVPGWSKEADFGVQKTGSGMLPPAARSGQTLARALVEVIGGRRPLSQLRVHCAPDVFAGLEGKPVQRGGMPQLTSVRICEPADGVAEVSAVYRAGGRARALAFRIQGLDGRWRVTALQTG